MWEKMHDTLKKYVELMQTGQKGFMNVLNVVNLFTSGIGLIKTFIIPFALSAILKKRSKNGLERKNDQSYERSSRCV